MGGAGRPGAGGEPAGGVQVRRGQGCLGSSGSVERRCLPSMGGWDKFRELRTLISSGPPGCQVLPGFPELSGRQRAQQHGRLWAEPGAVAGAPWTSGPPQVGWARSPGEGRAGEGQQEGANSVEGEGLWVCPGWQCPGGRRPCLRRTGARTQTSCSLLQTGRAVGWRATLEDSRTRACWRGLSACSTPAVGRALVQKRGPGGA